MMAKPQTLDNVVIESMSPEGRGVAHVNGKTVFVANALPDETVNIIYGKRRKQFDEAASSEIIKASQQRIEAKCEYFALCGGCSMQHLDTATQIKYKQQFMFEHLTQQAHVTPCELIEPLQASSWGYRRKARLGVKYVKKKQRVLVGFREKQSSFLADIHRCEILHEKIGCNLDLLSEFIGELDARSSIPQIEVAVTDKHAALIIRHLDTLIESDLDKIRSFAIEHEYVIYLQSKGPKTIKLFYPESASLEYELPEYNLTFEFGPADFTQVNQEINKLLIRKAIDLLNLSSEDVVLDLFCGIGNFTLPIARRANAVVGVEGSADLIARARSNALRNDILNAEFFTADLTDNLETEIWYKKGKYTALLIDPPRSGAKEFIDTIAGLDVNKILYVSCNPATLARDVNALVNTHGYKLEKCGVLDMFPHTSHVESIALFTRS